MSLTYLGKLRANQIEWENGAPPIPQNDQPVRVQVTILETNTTPEQGRRMAEALERLAALPRCQGMHDPIEWQREQRIDRTLPGRDE